MFIWLYVLHSTVYIYRESDVCLFHVIMHTYIQYIRTVYVCEVHMYDVRMLRRQYMYVCQHACLCLLLCSIYPPLCLRLLSQDEDLKQVSLLVLQSCLKQRLPVSDGQFLTLLIHTLYIQYIHTSTVHMYIYVQFIHTYTLYIQYIYVQYVHTYIVLCVTNLGYPLKYVRTYVCMPVYPLAPSFSSHPRGKGGEGGKVQG